MPRVEEGEPPFDQSEENRSQPANSVNQPEELQEAEDNDEQILEGLQDVLDLAQEVQSEQAEVIDNLSQNRQALDEDPEIAEILSGRSRVNLNNILEPEN